jgi:hypothetical protein
LKLVGPGNGEANLFIFKGTGDKKFGGIIINSKVLPFGAPENEIFFQGAIF